MLVENPLKEIQMCVTIEITLSFYIHRYGCVEHVVFSRQKYFGMQTKHSNHLVHKVKYRKLSIVKVLLQNVRFNLV